MQSEDQDENNWLDALKGLSPVNIDRVTLSEAMSVRTALIARRKAIEADADKPDPVQLERLRRRLKHEGFLSQVDEPVAHTVWQRLLTSLGLGTKSPSKVAQSTTLYRTLKPQVNLDTGGSGTRVVSRRVVLTLAVIGMLLVIRLVIQEPEKGPPADIFRGGTATVLIVPDPQVRLEELRSGLQGVKAPFTVKVLSNGRVQVDIEANTHALDYLETLRITPTVKDGSVRIVIQKPA